MDTPTIIGAALAFSVAALPLIIYLYSTGVKKDILLSEARSSQEMKNYFDKKIGEIMADLGHKKVSVEQLDIISRRLVKIADSIDPKDKLGIYDICER